MKKYLVAASILATMVSAPAFADGNNRNTDTEAFTLRANNPAKCNLEASDYTLRIAGNSISNNDGFALATVSAAVASEMNSAGVSAWCTGAKNTLQMYRTPFVTDGGNKGEDGFNRAVVYDVTMNIADAVRTDGFSPIEGTSDGKGNGPGVGVGSGLTVSRFGPTGAGSPVTFAQELGSEAVSNGGGELTARTSFTADSNRLIAGQYVSTLTIELTPGN
jgi:hypothetical protein